MEINSGKQIASVAVFDSGIGGLNLLKECAEAMPYVNFYYLADNYKVPYGAKSKEEIFSLVKSKLDLVADYGLSAAVIACNTATANCIEKLRQEYAFPLVGIQPAVKQAAKYGGKCLVLATPSTVKSASFNDLLSRYDTGNFEVYPCEGLAEYIEENVFNLGESLPRGLLPEVKVDCVVLGCTHYVFIKDIVKKLFNCTVFDGIAGTADHLREILGIADHFQENLGISAHLNDLTPNITFIGGDTVKNKQIYTRLLKI